MKRLIVSALVLATLLLAGPVTVADIAGDGSSHQVATSANGVNVRWIVFQAPWTNSAATCSATAITGCPRVGDASVSATRGIILYPGASFSDIETSTSAWYYIAQTGDKISITYKQ